MCWQARDRFDEAIAEFRRLIELEPKRGLGHDSLADALLRIGRFAEARTAVRRGLDVLPAEEPLRPPCGRSWSCASGCSPSTPACRRCSRAKDRSIAAEQLDLARFCRDHGRPEAAAGLYAAAFASRPELADDLETGDRYHAACAAARAADDEVPTGGLGGPSAGLRRQALAWLQADLALRARLSGGKSVDRTPTNWQTEPALASVRDPAALAKLPDDERQQWGRFWADVAAAPRRSPGTGPFRRRRPTGGTGGGRLCASLTRGQTDDGHFWFEYAARCYCPATAQATSGPAHMIERCGKAGRPAGPHVARACTLGPDTVTETSLPGRLAEKELKDSWPRVLVADRARGPGLPGRPFPRVGPLLRAEPPGRRQAGPCGAQLAVAGPGQAAPREGRGSRRWLKEAQAWLDQYRDGMPARAEEELGLHLHNWLEAHVLRREAEALIRPAEKR